LADVIRLNGDRASRLRGKPPGTAPVAYPRRSTMTTSESATGDTLPEHCTIIEVRVGELAQLFNSVDPAPFRERDLDPKLEEFIVEWGREAPTNKPLALLVRLDRPANTSDDAAVVRDAVHQYLAQRTAATRGRLRRLFRNGRISLTIGLAVLSGLTLLAELISRRTEGSPFGQVLHESLLIGGWVAMWRPLEIFLYDWWPIGAEAKLFNRLATMPVRISYGTGNSHAR
jgi:hypothetical protein